MAHTLLSLVILVCLAVFLDTMLEVLLMLVQLSALEKQVAHNKVNFIFVPVILYTRSK